MQPDGDDRSRRLAELEERERTVSARRRRLHDRIDYARGTGAAEADPDALARLHADERAVSDERRRLHAEIDALRAELGLPPFRERRREEGIERPGWRKP
jgi:hypothetical protein